jgi:hypothetical protein
MKTQIITAEAHDDLVSLRDRMSWAKSPRILLVWPGFEKLALRPLDLRILQQHAQYLGAQLGIVTRRADVRRDAIGFGIPVFRSSVEAQGEAWPTRTGLRSLPRAPASGRRPRLRSMREQARPHEARWASKPVTRIGFFIVGVAAVLALAALFIPRATIRLQPIAREQTVSLQVAASTKVLSVSITGSVPAHETTVTVSGTRSARITSQAPIPQDKAKGIVRFNNLTQSSIVIPPGTVVYPAGASTARFTTLDETRLLAKVNAFVEVPVEALQAGTAGNVPANSIQTIEGSLGTLASVTNPEATSGGSERLGTVPSDGDRQRLRVALLEGLETEARRQLDGSVAGKGTMLPNTVRPEAPQEEIFDPPADQPGSLLTLTMRLAFDAEYVKIEDLSKLADATFGSSTPAGFTGVSGSEKFDLQAVPTSDESGTSHFELKMQRSIVPELDLFRAGLLVRGLTPVSAARVLQAEMPLAGPPEIRLSPPWWPRLPLVPFRLTIGLQ